MGRHLLVRRVSLVVRSYGSPPFLRIGILRDLARRPSLVSRPGCAIGDRSVSPMIRVIDSRAIAITLPPGLRSACLAIDRTSGPPWSAGHPDRHPVDMVHSLPRPWAAGGPLALPHSVPCPLGCVVNDRSDWSATGSVGNSWLLDQLRLVAGVSWSVSQPG
jgi:hypothetical protein